jgi:hypothetical protein
MDLESHPTRFANPDSEKRQHALGLRRDEARIRESEAKRRRRQDSKGGGRRLRRAGRQTPVGSRWLEERSCALGRHCMGSPRLQRHRGGTPRQSGAVASALMPLCTQGYISAPPSALIRTQHPRLRTDDSRGGGPSSQRCRAPASLAMSHHGRTVRVLDLQPIVRAPAHNPKT